MRFLKGALAGLALGLSLSGAVAADLPVKARPMPVEVWNWAGFYLGGNIGYSWGRSNYDWGFISPGTGAVFSTGGGSHRLDGVVGGGQAGYNWQSGNWVFGLETDIQGTGERGTTGGFCVTPTAAAIGCPRNIFDLSNRIEWFGTTRGRLGMTVTPSWLIYITGGAAYGSVKTDISGIIGGAPASVSFSDTKLGWTVGGGIEGLFARNWSAKAEYLYLDLGTYSGTSPISNISVFHNSRVTDHILRFGINYHFPAGPVIARY